VQTASRALGLDDRSLAALQEARPLANSLSDIAELDWKRCLTYRRVTHLRQSGVTHNWRGSTKQQTKAALEFVVITSVRKLVIAAIDYPTSIDHRANGKKRVHNCLATTGG